MVSCKSDAYAYAYKHVSQQFLDTVVNWAKRITCYCQSDCQEIIDELRTSFPNQKFACFGQKGSAGKAAFTSTQAFVQANTAGWSWTVYVL